MSFPCGLAMWEQGGDAWWPLGHAGTQQGLVGSFQGGRAASAETPGRHSPPDLSSGRLRDVSSSLGECPGARCVPAPVAMALPAVAS